MKDVSILQIIAILLAFGAFGLVAYTQTLESLGAFTAGCLLMGFIAYLERKRVDTLDEFRAELKRFETQYAGEFKKIDGQVQEIILNRSLRK